MMTTSSTTWAVGDLCRVHGIRGGVGKILHLRVATFEADVWFGRNGRAGLRTFDTALLKPPRKGDVAPTTFPAVTISRRGR